MATRRTLLLAALTAPIALPSALRAQSATPAPTVLRLQTRQIEVNGRSATVFGITQPDGMRGIATDIGRPFRVRVENQIAAPSLIHWHGLTPPWQQDGVPGISGPAIPPGGSADYDFPLRFGGTFWMHSHAGLQEQGLMAAPLIIQQAPEMSDQQEIVVMLADFSFTPAEVIFEGLRRSGSMAGMKAEQPKTAGASMKAEQPKTAEAGMKADPANPADAAMAAMPDTAGASDTGPDLNDVKYDAFLANDRTLADPEVIAVEPGGRVLLRIINSSSMSAYHLDLGALDGELVAVDGFQVEPVTQRSFPIAVAQRLDIRLNIPREAAAYAVLAQLEGDRQRTGIILRAGSGQVTRVAEMAERASSALTLELERRLRAKAPLQSRPADRVHKIDLTGEMAGYIWSLNGVAWTPEVPPLPIAKGERVELVLNNRTPMPHPMHLHGHEFQVVEINGERLMGAVRDTILVPPKQTVVIAFDANNPGLWSFHCHLLYHLDAGMFTTLRYV